ncbi:MAG TPA: FecR family protein [Kofleriaceae bacterium]|jgi:hypothetical protein
MSGHVAPHRWADAWAGKIPASERAEMNAHAKKCRTCAKARARVKQASDSFGAIRDQSAPDLPWDSVRARVHWSVSTERHQRQSGIHIGIPEPRRWPWVAGALAAAAGVTVAVTRITGVWGGAAPVRAPIAVVLPTPAHPEPVAPATSLTGLVSRATGDVLVDGAPVHDLFARALGAGDVIATADGRVDVQFGDHSAFALGPRSTLRLAQFDAQTVQLAVTGTVDVEVAPRASGQRFLVVAGDRTIEVRGTQFRVTTDEHGGAATVACRHGLVAVRDAAGTIEVGAATRVELPAGARVVDAHTVGLSVDELGELAAATPLALPAWTPALAQTSSPLDVDPSPRGAHRDVRVDGVELGAAPLRVRVLPGRHMIESADAAGRYRRAGWVDVAAGTPAHVALPAERAVGDARSRELRANVDHKRLASCIRSIAKAGVTGTYVQIEIAVDAAGAVNELNIVDSDLGSATQQCVHDALADTHFGPGAAATWQERVDL